MEIKLNREMEFKWVTPKMKTIEIFSLLFFLAVLVVNYLANSLPINGKNTGQISKQYPNLFVPAPYTFSIWGVIYFSLLIFCVYAILNNSKVKRSKNRRELTKNIHAAFILTCILNISWIFAWHYSLVLLSVIIMVFFLLALILLNSYILFMESELTKTEKFFLKAPFGLYLGWICIATIANITALLISYGWRGAGIGEESWAFIMILIGSIIGIIAIFRFNNSYIGLSCIWAFGGIIVERRNNIIYHKSVELCAWIGIVIIFIAIFIELTNGILWKNGSDSD